jgi:hypothetical protein
MAFLDKAIQQEKVMSGIVFSVILWIVAVKGVYARQITVQ